MNTTTDYQKQADDFLKSCGATLTARFLFSGPYFPDDKDQRDVYEITITRKDRKPWVFKFGQSIAHSQSGVEKELAILDRKGFPSWSKKALEAKRKKQPPTAYDVLACIEKHDVGTFDDFCAEFGYDTDSRKAETLYFAVQKEGKECQRMFGDVLEALQEIQ